MPEKIKNFRDLDVWNKGIEIVKDVYIALGSCAELETQIEVAAELKYIDEQRKNSLLEKLDHESRMIRNLIKKLD